MNALALALCQSVHVEPGVVVDEGLAEDLARAARECATWHRTPEVRVSGSEPKKFAALLRKAVARRSGFVRP